MGKVYRALDKKLNEEVALKLVKPEIASDKKTLERFSNELKIARKIAHKNVGRMYELMEEKGTHFITMEYVPGEDLKSFIKRSRQLNVGTAVLIAKQVCEGLGEAHRLGVVHRDLKPQNIMIDKEGNSRIMDFGIARSLKAKGITAAGVMIGTPEYMSPEQVDAKETDQRSDIYSLGVILYEMVTGRVPFEGDTPLSVAVKQKTETPEDPRKLNSQIPEDLSRVILRCMEKDKGKRYQSTGELRSELINIEEGIPTTERVVPKRKPITSREITVTFGLKKLFIPALVIIALAIAIVITWSLLPKKEPVSISSAKHSIAILPFVDLSPAKDHEYLCDGIAETLISGLSSIKDLHIPARTSAFSFKAKDMDIREIGQKLNVETLLEGSVQVAGDRLRITARLSNVDDGYQLWSESYERGLEDVFAVQDDIAQKIVKALKIELLGEKETQIVMHYTENSRAYQLYLKGRYFWNKRTEEGYKKAIEHFDLAIKEDPSYALAFTGLADSYFLLGSYAYLQPKEAMTKAKKMVQKALEIDDSLAEAHTSLAGIFLNYDFDWDRAEREFKRAIKLNPSYATAYHWYAHLLSRLERHEEAIANIKRAQELDPLSLVINSSLGDMLYNARQYDQALDAYQKVLEMNPDFWIGHTNIPKIYVIKGMYERAIAKIQEIKSLSGGWYPELETWTGIAYIRLGKRDKAQEVLNNLIERSKKAYVPSTNLAKLYFALGENDQGFKYLEKAYEERHRNMTFLRVNPAYDRVRPDPRFKAMLKKMNLE
jgi:serine/threonine protein kinase/Tfp pilus assembly protein PilF